MKTFSLFVGLVFLASGAFAQTPETNISALRGSSLGGNATAIVVGWYNPADAGGGTFYSDDSPYTCRFTGVGAVSSTNLNVIEVTGRFSWSQLALNMWLTSSAFGVTNDPVTAFDQNATPPTITVQSPASGPSSGSFDLNGDNGGTQIVDGSGYCYHRATTNYGPKEWGAHGDGSSDDTAPLQNWLNALQPHYGVAGTFMVTSPLTCPADTTVQGPSNLTGNNPLFTIMASSSFSGLLPPDETQDSDNNPITVQGVIGALAYCRLSGVNIVGNGYFLPTTGSTMSGSNCITVAATTGLNVGSYVVGGNIAEQTTVLAVASCGTGGNVMMSQNATGTSSGENITFYGPDAADVLAERVTIDGFSALSYGGRNLVCINTKAPEAGLQVKNSQLTFALDEDVHSVGGCPNARFIGDIVSFAGEATGYGPSGGGTVKQVCGTGNPTCSGEGMNLSGAEATISDGVIEESQGAGLDLHGAQKISVNAMHIQGNGEGPLGGQGIRITGTSEVISVCGNHLEGNGGDVANSAQVYFAGVLDSIGFCGNVYEPQSFADVALRPSYVYDADPGTVFTNTHFYDAPAPQAAGQIYSSAAAQLLPQLQVPHTLPAAISGLVLSNDSVGTQVNVSPGEASDSSDGVTIELASACNDNLADGGAGGLDSGAGTNAANSTYFYFVIGSASGGNPSCIASLNMVPSLVNAGPSYSASVTGSTQSGFPYVYNMSTVAGIAAGNGVQSASGGTAAIVSVGTLTSQVPATLANICSPACTTVATLASGTTANMAPGMAVSDALQFPSCSNTAVNAIAAGSTVGAVQSGTTFTITPTLSTAPGGDCVVVSSGNTVQLSSALSGSAFTVYNGTYRLIGALYTDASKNVVSFTQDGDTFYLARSVTDIQTGSLCPAAGGTVAIPCPLSVPCGRTASTCVTTGGSGLSIQAFGRIVGGSGYTLLSSLDQAPQPPTSFPGAPGYTTDLVATNTAYPFRLHTDSRGNVRVQSSTPSSTVEEVTDGWLFQR